MRRKQAEEAEKKRAIQRAQERLAKQKAEEKKQLQQEERRSNDASSKLIQQQKTKMAQDAINRRMGSYEDDTTSPDGRASNIGLLKSSVQSPDRPFEVRAGGGGVEGSPRTDAAPTAAQFKQATEFFDLTFKFVTMLNSLSEIFRVTSMLEFLLFFIAMIFFFVGPDKSVWFGVLALFHVARAFMGLAMQRVIPSSYDFVEKLEFKGSKQLIYANVKNDLSSKVKDLLLEYYGDFEKLAKFYTLLALITTVLDVISFFAVYGLLASRIGDLPDNLTDDQIEVGLTPLNPHLGRIMVIMLYTFCDIVFLLWILHFQMRLGDTERTYALKALLGSGNEMRISFGKNFNAGSRNSAPKPGQKNKPGARRG